MGSDTWNDVPSTTEGAGWKADAGSGGGGGAAGGFEPDGGADDTWTGEITEANVSKHADDGFGDGGAPADGGCRTCGEDGHFARDCPDKPANSGECYNCGEPGHSKADCTNPRVEREFTGECNACGQVGHRRADCPDKPPSICKLCKEAGHIASECSANRMFTEFAGLGIEEMSPEEAWKAIEVADKEKDVDDIKKALLTYAKAFPVVTFKDLDDVFREAEMNTYLIAKQQEVSDTHTIVNLQGQGDQKYVISVQFTAKPRRAKFAEGWPTSPEENTERLAEAGFPMDRMVPKCHNCDQMGHVGAKCPEEKVEREKLAISCANCNEEGHRARDCTAKRKTPGAKECKNCGEEGHIGKDCPHREPDVCRNCGQEGHRAKECENERVMQCRNCDEYGHSGKECPKPRDWSRVECSICHEKGHGRGRCPQKDSMPQEEANGDGGDFDGGAAAATGGGDWGGDEAPAEASGGW